MEISLSESGSEEDAANTMEAIMRAQREAMGSIMQAMEEKEDLEYFTLLEKMEVSRFNFHVCTPRESHMLGLVREAEASCDAPFTRCHLSESLDSAGHFKTRL